MLVIGELSYLYTLSIYAKIIIKRFLIIIIRKNINFFVTKLLSLSLLVINSIKNYYYRTILEVLFQITIVDFEGYALINMLLA